MATYLPVLKLGMTHAEVVRLRQLLNKKGFDLGVDASPASMVFTQAVSNAVYQFQARTDGLAVDGIVGRNTWAALLGVPASQVVITGTGSTTPVQPEAIPVATPSKTSPWKILGAAVAGFALWKLLG